MAKRTATQRLGYALGVLVGVAALAAALLYTTSFGKGLRDVAGSGAVQAALKPHEDLVYVDASSDANLRSFATALKLYQESEGQYPDAGAWMDRILPNMTLNNLPRREAEKKLARPGLPPGAYGYALNDAAAGKYVGDLPKGTVLVFESAATGRNAHGDPRKDARPHARALTVEGALVRL